MATRGYYMNKPDTKMNITYLDKYENAIKVYLIKIESRVLDTGCDRL